MGGITHGHTRAGKSLQTYWIWQCMKKRCNNPNYHQFHLYGGRGIRVCERWNDYANFLADMGEKPEGRSLDRFPNRDGNYEPGNVRWATTKEQNINTCKTRMIEFNGETLCLRDWERKLGLGYGTLWRRLAKGEPVAKALRRAWE